MSPLVFMRQWPVRWLVPAWLAVFGVLAALAYHGFRSHHSLDLMWHDRQRQLMERLSLEQTRLDVQMGAANKPLVRRLVSGLALHEGLDHAYLVAPDGRVQASISRLDSGRPLAELQTPVAQVLRQSRNAAVPGIVVSAERSNSRLLGWVPLFDGWHLAVAVDLRQREAQTLYEARRESLVAGAMTLALAGVLAWLLHVVWFRRSARLVEQLGRIADGDLGVRLGTTGKDELAQIGRAVDDMVARLAGGEAELHRMLAIVNRSPVVVIEWRNAPGWPVSFVSDAVRQWGYAPQDLLDGRFTYNDLFHPDDVQRVNEEIAGYFASGPDVYRQEYRLRRADGQWAHIIDDTTLTRDASGQVTGISGMLMDVSAQQRAEEQLRLQSDRVARFYELPFIGMAMTSPQTRRWLQVNDRLCEILGYSREQLLSLSWVQITHPDDLQGNLALFDELLANERQHYQMTKRFIRGDGQVVHTEIDVRARRLPDGSVSEIYTTIQDITDRLRSEAELQRLGAMADNASDALLLTVDGRIEDCNAAALRIFGYPDRATFLGQLPSDLSPPCQADGMPSDMVARERIGAAMAGQTQQFEWRHLRFDGAEFDAEVSLNRFQATDGRHALIGVVRDVTARKRQEARLRESETQLREAQRIGRMGSWAFDLQTGRVTWSDETYRIQGLDPARDEASFERFLALIHPEDRLRVEQDYRESVDMGRPYETRYRIVLGDGRIRHLHVRGETEYREGQAQRSVGMVADETELVEAQAERDRLVAVLENTSDIVSMADAQGRVFYFNRAGYELMGLVPGQQLDGVMAQVHPPWAFRKVAEEGIPAAMRGELWMGDTAVYNAQAEEVPMSQLIGAQMDEDGQVRFLWTILRDVSDRMRAARALEETKDMLEQGEALVRMGSWTYDSDSKELHWSRQTFANIGLPWSPRPPSIDEYCTRIHPDDVAPVRAAIEQLVAGGEVPEVRFRTHPDLGTVRWLQRVIQKIDRVQEGKGPRYVGTLLDITDAVETEAQLRAANQELEHRVAERTAQLQEANRDLEAFTYTVSHDLKAPLRGIDGYSQLLVEDYGRQLGEEGQMFAERIRRGVTQMGELISDLLDYSRMERRAMEPQALDILPLLEQVIEGYEADIERHGVKVRRQLVPVTLRVDREGMAVVLRNLIGNAIKFSQGRSQPVLEVGSRVDTDRCLLWVRDNGVGFDMQYHERIFGIFQRLHRAEDYPGTGVGLALVAKAVQRMGGRVWAESRLGEGATFFMEFPR